MKITYNFVCPNCEEELFLKKKHLEAAVCGDISKECNCGHELPAEKWLNKIKEADKDES